MIHHQRGKVPYLQFSHFAQFPQITHGIFTRLGGCSEAPYWSLNVSCSTGDSMNNVMRNRLLVLQTLGLQTYACATLWLIHSPYVATVETDTWSDWHPDWPCRSSRIEQQELIWSFSPLKQGDAFITKQSGIALALSFADCVPLLFYDPIQKVLGMAHAGWRGNARGIALATIEAMCTYGNCQPQNIYAGIGPSIGPCCYKVSKEIQLAFSGEDPFGNMPTCEKYCSLVRESAVFSLKRCQNGNHLQLNLWETLRKQLLMVGISSEHIESSEICTHCDTDRFFSHRHEQGKTGRFAVILALRNGDET